LDKVLGKEDKDDADVTRSWGVEDVLEVAYQILAAVAAVVVLGVLVMLVFMYGLTIVHQKKKKIGGAKII